LLEQIFEISAEYWMSLQSQFELDQARLKQKTKERLANAAAWSSAGTNK
jgi:plasmid maintenance system antidote protein VapI